MRYLLLSCIAICLAVPAIASEKNIEEVEVLGKRQAADTAIDVNLETYNGFANIIDRAEFENRLVDVSDIINQSISAQVLKDSGFGSYSAASIRGSTGKQIDLYLDGMLLTSPDTGYSRLSGIPTSIIEQIQIFPDFTPVELGSANLGGAINIKTRKAKAGFGGRAALSFGSFNTQQQDLDFWGGSDQTQALLALSHTKSDNDYPINKKVICENMTCGTSRRRENANYQQYSALSKLSHQFNDSATLHVLLGSSQSKNDVPAQNNRTSHQANLENALHQFNSLFEMQLDSFRWGARFYGNQQNQHFQDSGALIVGNGADIKQKQTQLGINSFVQYEVARNTLGFNIDYSQSDNHTNDKQKIETLKSQRKRLLLALSDTIQATEHLSFHAILRGNYIDDSSQNKINGLQGSRCSGTEKACLENKKLHPSWQLGSAWQQGHWRIQFNLGKMVRVPTLRERFGETGAFLGKANLKSETSQNSEMGFIFDNKHSYAQLNAFYKKLENGIFTSYDARGVAHPDNMDKSIIYGVEALFKQKFAQYFTIYLGGQWMDSENKSPDKANNGKKISGIYHYNNQAGFQFQTSQHQIDIHYQIDSELYYNAANSRKAKSRELLNASYTFFIQNFSWNISVNNLLNYHYVDFDFMPAPGRSFTTTLAYNF